MRYRRNKRNNMFILLFMLVVGLGVGYALISSNLTINGIGKFNNQSWDVHFEDLTLNPGNVELSSGDVAASIDQTTMTDITFTVTLQEPGDFYEFEVAAVNSGSMDAMIGLVTNNLNGNPISDTNPVPTFASYSATYSDGVEIAPYHLLEAGYSETYKVRVEYRTDINPEDLPNQVEELSYTFGVQYVQKDANTVIEVPHPETLYGVLESYAQEGTYAMKYTGAHQDSFAGTGNKDIYHWYADNDTNGEAILNMNNVIFAGQCWQIIRTTDTGGVKLIYNGEVENNQCLNTRGNHAGYSTFSEYVSLNGQNSNGGYYYGTDYTYDSTSKLFTLSGTIEKSIWDASTAPNLIGKYTCKGTIDTDTCQALYMIDSYKNSVEGYTYVLNNNSHYSQFGTLPYNSSSNSLSYVGYMYNDVYPVTRKANTFLIQDGSISIDTNYYFSDTVEWNTTMPNLYTLPNPQQVSTLNGDYSSLVGKYILAYGGGGIGTGTSKVYYIVSTSNSGMYYKTLSDGDLNISLTVGDSYIESGGVYTLVGNVTNVTYLDWYYGNSRSSYMGKYMCDGDNTSCTNLKHIDSIYSPASSQFYYIDTANTYSYSESVSYDGTTYTLTGDIKTFWDFYDATNQSYLLTHRYTCLDNGTSCTTVGYVYYLGTFLQYVQFSNEENIETAINTMLYANNVNTKNSMIKVGIDAWYENYLSGYDEFIEDTIFCNDRTIQSLGGWDSSSGSVTNTLKFQEFIYSDSKDLSCDRVTDQFSTLNPSALLTYKVGLISSPEMNLLNNKKLSYTEYHYWLLSPSGFDREGAFVKEIYYTSGGVYQEKVSRTCGIRPSISLIPGITYSSGDGSMTNPFVIE